jgi:general stress protein 26
VEDLRLDTPYTQQIKDEILLMYEATLERNGLNGEYTCMSLFAFLCSIRRKKIQDNSWNSTMERFFASIAKKYPEIMILTISLEKKGVISSVDYDNAIEDYDDLIGYLKETGQTV